MIQVVIIKESEKIVNQSAKLSKSVWHIQFLEKPEQRRDSLAGWTASNNTQFQVDLSFDSLESALEFAKKQNYQVQQIERTLKVQRLKKSYADNFKNKSC